MNKLLFSLFSFLLSCSIIRAQNADIVIVGGTPGGIMAAIAAARMQKSVILLERTEHIGGLPANGLGATDISTRGATTGLFLEFVQRIKAHYVNTYGSGSPQVEDCSDGYHFEPSVAEKVFEEMLAEHPKIQVHKMRQFDALPSRLRIEQDQIRQIQVLNRTENTFETYTARVFIDATYEGDLAAAAGVPYRVGREGKSEFQEPFAGVLYKYWDGPEGEGSTHLEDNAIQAYNYRLCLTNNSNNLHEITKPADYNRNEYLSLIQDVWQGNHTGIHLRDITKAQIREKKAQIAAGKPAQTPGMRTGIDVVTNKVALPNQKTDANNQHLAFISTDLPEENWPWPTSDWEWRDRFAERLKSYTLGLLFFAQQDAELPESFKKACQEWGLSKDEYTDNDNFPRQVYVREGRRMEGKYLFTAHDALPENGGLRPPIHPTSITSSHYSLDSHATRKRQKNRVHLDGFFNSKSYPYTVPYGVILPKTISNLLFPVPVSGTHVGFSTLRMEPCWMALGQAAGIASGLAIAHNTSVQEVPIGQLQEHLLKQKASLIYLKDIKASHPKYTMFQKLGLQGYFQGWEASPEMPVLQEDLYFWESLSGLTLNYERGKAKRLEVLKYIYQTLFEK